MQSLFDRWKTAVAIIGILITLVSGIVKGAMWVQHVNDALAKNDKVERYYHGVVPAEATK
jgi:hypothetical protein